MISARFTFGLFAIFVAVAQTPIPAWKLSTVTVAARSVLSSIHFVGPIGWICADRSTILSTRDNGQTWRVLKTNLPEPDTEISRLWFANDKAGWAAGAIANQPTLWRTEDGGVTWVLAHRISRAYADLRGSMLDIEFAGMRGWAVGFNGFKALILRTIDGGEHWTTQYSGSEITGQFRRVRFADPDHGWALSETALMETSDAGETWRLRYFDSGILNDVDFRGDSEVWLAGSWSSLLHSSNGVNWLRLPLEVAGNGYVASIKFANAERGWATGVSGQILATEDGGRTWVTETIPDGVQRADLTTGEIGLSDSMVFVIANPGHLLSRAQSRRIHR